MVPFDDVVSETMAKLENDKGHFLELQPVAYQFSSGDDKYDLNWLQVKFDADNGECQWTATHPAFLNWELTDLVKWLRKLVASDTNTTLSFHATEPCLKFKAVRAAEKIGLEATLGYKLSPPQLAKKDRYRQRMVIHFEDSGSRILQFAFDLEKEVERFPVRY